MRHGRLASLLIVALLFGCTLAQREAALPVLHTVEREQLVVHSDFEVPRYHRLLDELIMLRAELCARLQLPQSDEPIHIYLFDTSRHYEDYLRQEFPNAPARRAVFVETDTRLAVYGFWGDFVAEDLRHEVSHGYLHAVVPNLPLWLDEGLAEYFEVERRASGLNTAHVELLQREFDAGTWQPDLSRLEGLTDISQMTLRDYAESWLWVHYYLHSSDQRVERLRNYLARLRMLGTAPPFSENLLEGEQTAEDDVVRWLSDLSPKPLEQG